MTQAAAPPRRVVLLRGLMREHAHWGSFPDALRQRWVGGEVLTPDLPGNGLLWQQPSPLRVADMVDAVRHQVRQAWGTAPGPVHVMALSMGGMVATNWASKHPEEVSSLCLMSSSMRPFSALTDRLRPGQWGQVLRLVRHSHQLALRERIVFDMTCACARADQVLPQWEAIQRSRPVSTANALRQLWAAARFRAPLSAPPVPTLVLSGQQDALVHPRCSEAIARCWRATHASHPSAGHDLPLDAPDWVLAHWLRFVAP
ncbi:MAG: hypothetical protein RI907_3944 [Pseudomonadota bacterium]|jgi:pimeloyl-ACP methyl ester carboxylesterase